MARTQIMADTEELKKFIKYFNAHSKNSKENIRQLHKIFQALQTTWKGNQADKFSKLFEQYYKSTNKLLDALEKELIPDLKRQQRTLDEYNSTR